MDELSPTLHVLLDPLAMAFRQEVHELFFKVVAAWIVPGSPYHQPGLGDHRPNGATQPCLRLSPVQRGRLELG
jgi:hypothetical protein